MKPLLVVIAIPVVVAITPPAVIPVSMTKCSVTLVTIPVRVSFTFIPSVMMPLGCLVGVMIAVVRTVPSIPSVTISESIATQGKCKPNQRDADDHKSAYHVALLRFGLRTRLCGLFGPYDESER